MKDISISKPTASLSKHDEHIMVIERAQLFGADSAWSGVKSTGLERYLERIRNLHTFLPRSRMELDPAYKQVIPYIVFKYQDSYFLMERHAQATEQRLRNKLTLGIGGHIRQEDVARGDIAAWAFREFYEEVAYTGALNLEVLGLINDDSNSVGLVHVGVLMLVQGDNAAISVKSELKNGRLVTLQECRSFYSYCESWSQIVLDFFSTSSGAL